MLFILALVLAAGIITFYKPWYGLVVIALINPMDIPIELGITIHTNEFILAGIFTGWLLHILRRKAGSPISRSELFLAAPFIIALLLSALNAYEISSVCKQSLRWLQLIILAWYAANALRSEREVRVAILVLIITGALVSILGIIQTLAGPDSAMNSGLELLTLYSGTTMRAYSTFGHPNQFAGYIILVIPLAFIQFVEARQYWERFILGLAAVIMITALIFTFTRAAWLAVFLVGLVLIYMNVPKKLLWIGVLLIAISVTVFLLNQGPLEKARQAVLKRVTSLGHPGQEDSVSFRKVCFITAVKMFQQHPLIGFGAGEYERNIRKYFNEDYYAWQAMDKHIHNLYLQILIETGLLGLFSFLLLIAYYLTTMIKGFFRLPRGYPRQVLSGLIAGSIAFLIHNNFDVLTIFARGIHFGIIIGMGLAIARWKLVPTGRCNSPVGG
ncbi:O-antigen ligase family protein [bacterium]|nr:O-antigen ligase family protein [bacterium]